MSTTEVNNTSKQTHKMNEQQPEQSFLNHKHQRDLKGCTECLSSNEELLTFNKLKSVAYTGSVFLSREQGIDPDYRTFYKQFQQ